MRVKSEGYQVDGNIKVMKKQRRSEETDAGQVYTLIYGPSGV
jgi:hypothetical protein